MQSRRFLTTTLIMLLLASVMTLSAESTQPSGQASTPESLQASTLYTEDEVVAALKVGIKAALDQAVPLAVQAAVADERSKTATAQSLAESWKTEYKKVDAQRLTALGIGFGVGTILTVVVMLLVH